MAWHYKNTRPWNNKNNIFPCGGPFLEGWEWPTLFSVSFFSTGCFTGPFEDWSPFIQIRKVSCLWNRERGLGGCMGWDPLSCWVPTGNIFIVSGSWWLPSWFPAFFEVISKTHQRTCPLLSIIGKCVQDGGGISIGSMEVFGLSFIQWLVVQGSAYVNVG